MRRYINKNGFTLLEIIFVIALMSIIAGFSLPIFERLLFQNDLGMAGTLIVNNLRRAQTLSTVVERDLAWGVEVAPGTLTLFARDLNGNRIEIYDENYSLPNSITFSGRTSFTFNKLTGEVDEPGSINIINSAGNESRTITINRKGLISL